MEEILPCGPIACMFFQHIKFGPHCDTLPFRTGTNHTLHMVNYGVSGTANHFKPRMLNKLSIMVLP
jgi:hypothetical protein